MAVPRGLAHLSDFNTEVCLPDPITAETRLGARTEVSTLKEDELSRLRSIRWAAEGQNFENFPVTRSDIQLMARRIVELDMAADCVSEEMLRWTLERLKEDRKSQREWLADLVEQMRIAELQAMEADEAVKAVEALIAGGMHIHGDEINRRWDDVAEDFQRRGLLPPEPVPYVPAEPPIVVESPGMLAEPVAEVPAQPEPVAAVPVPEPDDAPPPRVLGQLAQTQPGDPLTDKQAAVFRAILSAAGEDWRAVISQGRMAKISGVKPGGMWTHIDALERKDYIRVLDRGNSTTPGAYFICERARPERGAAPKTDAELIAEALAAGKVTACPPAHIH